MEAAEFRDEHDRIVQAHAAVLGISTDGSDALCAFGDRLGLPYNLASDRTGEVRRLYDVRRRFGLGTSRFTYVVDDAGVIRNVYHNEFVMKSHAQSALMTLETLLNGQA